ncbi:helix-turn-helix domain-containing protein [Oscillospiraceae bacterium MB08-C2-2]|nr:helix-turn-helix domain-containing protein [Oscillospiraceae bacterium MB08-C2-2]
MNNIEAVNGLFADYPDIVTHANLCDMLRISKNTAYELLRSGQLPYIKIGSKYLIPKSSIIDYVAHHLR